MSRNMRRAERRQEKSLSNIYFELGNKYIAGLGVERNYTLAAEHYQQAVQLGHATAKFNLALLHEHGLGVAKNGVAAVHLYSQAMLEGVEQAVYNLARLYHLGLGVAQDISAAVM
ncbi:MAG TPA: tetratricopeptide repeat protein, partial [Chroococcales cyanobacterium]